MHTPKVVDIMDMGLSREIVDKLEAIKEARRQGANVEYAVKVLADYISTNGRTGPDLNDIARSILANPLDPKEDKSVVTELMPDILLASAFLADKIAPWVNIVREKLFGSHDAPFQTFEEAVTWLEDEERKELDTRQHDKPYDEQEAHFLEAHSLIMRLSRMMRCRVTLNREVLPYPGKDGWLKYIPVQPTVSLVSQSFSGRIREFPEGHSINPLASLHKETLSMAKATGFPQVSLVMHLLANIKPFLSRVHYTKHPGCHVLPTGGSLETHSITLDIRGKNLTFDELRRLHQHIVRSQPQGKTPTAKHCKTATAKHLELYNIVNRKGGPPHRKGTVAFWESVRQEWNQGHPQEIYATWKGLQKSYDRIIARLDTAWGSQKEAHHEGTYTETG